MRTEKGQTALILILLAAGALIFLAISLNWGRVAQNKTMLTIAADQAVSTLASSAASYGEMQKQTYLGNTNKYSALGGWLISFILLAIAIAISFVGLQGVAFWLVISSIIMLSATIVIQFVVLQPMITSLWNKLQKNQPVAEQFYEQGISTALGGTVTDQVNITDYLDSNANGIFGMNAANTLSKDLVSRFALFYTDRLKMQHTPNSPQLIAFYNQLNQFVNGGGAYPMKLSEQCTDTSNPYCNPCCQPAWVADPFAGDGTGVQHPNAVRALRPLSCCAGNTVQHGNITTCPDVAPMECNLKNPFSPVDGTPSPYPFLYDSMYQANYSNGTSVNSGMSFLDQFGRDMPGPALLGTSPFDPPLVPFPPVPSQYNMVLQGQFPNGVFPFFWEMKDYSPDVYTINASSLKPAQYHWCDASAAPGYTNKSGIASLDQLDLNSAYGGKACVGADCCVNNLASATAGIYPNSYPTPGPSDVKLDKVQDPDDASSNPALNPTFGMGGQGAWQEGDNQMCVSTWPYNDSFQTAADGVCEWYTDPKQVPNPPPENPSADPSRSTMDALDETVHATSDFVKFSNQFLAQDMDSINANFDAWYAQITPWIAPACSAAASDSFGCSDGLEGRMLGVYHNLQAWANGGKGLNSPAPPVQAWMDKNAKSDTWTSEEVWCVPSETTLLKQANGGTDEDNAIKAAGPWGGLPSVIACLQYNAATDAAAAPANLYQACLNKLIGSQQGGSNNSTACSVNLQSLPPECAPALLGRSLNAKPAPVFTPSKAYPPQTQPPSTTPGQCSQSSNTSQSTTLLSLFVWPKPLEFNISFIT